MQIQILHNIYVKKLYLFKFLDIENKCSFCNRDSESLTHLFYHCSCSLTFWTQIERYILCKTTINVKIDCKSVITYFVHKNNNLEFITNLIILFGKFHIHKSRYAQVTPNFTRFSHEFAQYTDTLDMINTTKSNRTIKMYRELFNVE